MIADIPGVIGGGGRRRSGIQFLRHLSRTRLLLHLVDMAPMDERLRPPTRSAARAEVEKFGHDLAQRERWLVLTKRDLLDAEEFDTAGRPAEGAVVGGPGVCRHRLRTRD